MATPTAAAAVPTPQPTPTVHFAHVAGVETDKTIIPDPKFSAWPHINLKEAQRLQKARGVVFADMRAKVEWDQSHIPGAICVPQGEFDAYYSKSEKKFKKARIIVVYCHGVGCHLSDLGCQHFHDKGYKNVVNFYGGWPDWSGAKLPIQDGQGKLIVSTPVPAPAMSPTPTPQAK